MENSINERIRIIAKNNGITLKELSEMIGFAYGTINNMYSRGTKPSYEMIYNISKAFPDVSMDWLINGEGDITNQTIIPEDIVKSPKVEYEVKNQNNDNRLIEYLKEKEKEIRELLVENTNLKNELENIKRELAKQRTGNTDVANTA